ncbi:MAG: PilZ domain-containing protein [Polyangiaceae bacterium]|nr:PilZ domain-containing protein [Polyangiaceae bacterium]
MNERVHFSLGGRELEGWALNLSAGGVRAVMEEPIEPGVELDVAVGESARRRGRVVWMQEEVDGSIVGVSFLDADLPPR